jgi:hypothetical protein
VESGIKARLRDIQNVTSLKREVGKIAILGIL